MKTRITHPKRRELYEHCVSVRFCTAQLLGEHGLPLIGSGDWNDGMNLVGEHGRRKRAARFFPI